MPLYYDILGLTSQKITQVFHLLLGFAENLTIFWDFKIQNSIWITKDLDNGDSDNQGSIVLYQGCFKFNYKQFQGYLRD